MHMCTHIPPHKTTKINPETFQVTMTRLSGEANGRGHEEVIMYDTVEVSPS